MSVCCQPVCYMMAAFSGCLKGGNDDGTDGALSAAKVAALLWWQQQEQPETAARAQCAADGVAASGCLFLDGARFRLRLGAGHGAPLVLLAENVPPDVRELSASFRMKDMDMGPNRFRLAKQADGSWRADGVYLPFCASGRRDWIVEWQADGRRFQAAFATE